MDSGQWSLGNEGTADHQGMATNQYSMIMTCYKNTLFPAGTPNMDDLWNQSEDQDTVPTGTHAQTPDMEDLWDTDPQCLFNIS